MAATRESQTPPALSNSTPRRYPLAMKRTVHMKSSAFSHFALFRLPPPGDVCFKTQIPQISALKSSPADCKTAKLFLSPRLVSTLSNSSTPIFPTSLLIQSPYWRAVQFNRFFAESRRQPASRPFGERLRKEPMGFGSVFPGGRGRILSLSRADPDPGGDLSGS